MMTNDELLSLAESAEAASDTLATLSAAMAGGADLSEWPIEAVAGAVNILSQAQDTIGALVAAVRSQAACA